MALTRVAHGGKIEEDRILCHTKFERENARKKKRYKYQYTITYFVQLKGFENTKAIKIDE